MSNKKIERKIKSEGKANPSSMFLPNPSQLAAKESTVKVTLLLNKSTIDYFKNAADKHGACYQAMIRNLLDEYVKHYQNAGTSEK